MADGGEVDEILRSVVRELVAGGATWAGILFVEDDELVLGPEAGTPDPAARLQVPVVYERVRVAELAADGTDDQSLLERVATLVAEFCLVGWDTGGIPWEDA